MKKKFEKDTVIYNTIPTFLISYRKGISLSSLKAQNQKFEEWLKIRMNNEKLRAVPY